MDNLATAWGHLRAGRSAEAERLGRQVVQAEPDNAGAWYVLGLASLGLNRLDDALNALRSAERLAPDSPEIANGLGITLGELKRLDEAADCFRTAARLRPDQPEPCVFLGNTLRALGRFDEALDAYETAIRLGPDHAEAHNGRGFALDELGRYEEAVASYDRTLRLAPGHVEAHTNRGISLGKLGRYEEAIASHEQALRIDPDFPDAHRNRALARLTLGDYARGWPEYEWRWKCRGSVLPPHPRPLWRGEPLEGRTILLHAEQGLGDTIQFVRFAALVQERGGRVVVECQPPLVPLLRTCPGIRQVVPKGDPLPEFDVHASLMSLPALLGTTLETVPAMVPYLSADPALVARWRERLESLDGLLIGIVWQGNPKYQADRMRSYPLSLFEGLARVEGARLVSLQKGPGTEQIRELGGRFPVVDFGDELDRGDAAFLDTSAVMKGLDLVITPNTATAHLAGALGVPFWLPLPFGSDWRWLLGQERSPWYPSARLFHQPEPGRWGPVFERMAACLAEAR